MTPEGLAMTELQRLIDAVPPLGAVGPQAPYLRLHWSAGDGAATVDADIEWGEDPQLGGRVAVAITEQEDGLRQPVMAAVFRADTGALIAHGPTVSLAKPAKWQDLVATVQSLIANLRDLKPLETIA